MKLRASPKITLHIATVVAATAIGGAGTLLIVACGGGENAEVPIGQVVELDVDTLGSADAIEREAATSRGAPGDAQPALFLVRAAVRRDADAAAAELVRRGFETVLVHLPAHDKPPVAAR